LFENAVSNNFSRFALRIKNFPLVSTKYIRMSGFFTGVLIESKDEIQSTLITLKLISINSLLRSSFVMIAIPSLVNQEIGLVYSLETLSPFALI